VIAADEASYRYPMLLATSVVLCGAILVDAIDDPPPTAPVVRESWQSSDVFEGKVGAVPAVWIPTRMAQMSNGAVEVADPAMIGRVVVVPYETRLDVAV
jgi:hypothetical protein